jgi:hypothetical protein
MSVDDRVERTSTTMDRASLRLPVILLLTGQLLYIVITQFHTGGDANDHPVIFAKYAASADWKAVHAGQFLAMAVMIAGLIALYYALDIRAGGAALAARLGAVSAAVALTLYAVLQAVDGVGNKQVDAAWVHAPAAQKAATFASADAMRWLEWGVRSYHDYALGLALVLFAGAASAVRAVTVPRAAAVLMVLSGVAYLAQGWVVGSEGFSGTNSLLIVVAWALSLAWMIWLAVGARRMPNLQAAVPGLAG